MVRLLGDIGETEKMMMCVNQDLTGVCPPVCFEVRALGVHFVAAREVAAVNSTFFQCVRRFSRERTLCSGVNNY